MSKRQAGWYGGLYFNEYGDTLIDTRPDAASGNSFLKALQKAYEREGLTDSWSLFSIQRKSDGDDGAVFIWAHDLWWDNYND